jgi:UDP-3-O-[3-hydroxymyristoyl] glucosamine N-acyltransferase
LRLTAADIASTVNGNVIGNPDKEITGVAKIEGASSDSLCFISNKKYIKHLATTNAGIVLVGKNITDIPEGKTVIQCDDAYVAFCTMLIMHFDYEKPHKGIHATAVIEESASIGNNVYLGPNVYVGPDVTIGDNTMIYANCSIYENASIGSDTVLFSNVSVYYECVVGNHCIIHSGTAIGSDGFGHAPLPNGEYAKIPQIGNVIIGNNVETGSNCCIDRANMGSTVIGDGCKLDNMVQIAHGAEIGANTVIAGQTGVAGSTKVGKNVTIAAQVGVAGHLNIADKVLIGGQCGVSKDIIEEGIAVTDTPHMPFKDSMKSQVLYRNLPKLEQRIRDLEQKIKELENNG